MFFVVCCFVSKKLFQEYHQNVKQLGSRSGPVFSWAWSSTWVQTICKVISGKVLKQMPYTNIMAAQYQHSVQLQFDQYRWNVMMSKWQSFQPDHGITVFITYSERFCRNNPKSAYAISSFPPTGYQPVMMITRSHAFWMESGYHAQHKTLIIRWC